MTRTLLIGEAPSKTGEATDTQPFDGGRLERILGASPTVLFETVNLLDYWPGSNGSGSAFPAAEGAAAASAFDLTGRKVILAGRRVARAFDLPDVDWFEWVEHRSARIAVMPHPSGVNRWWNDPDNTDYAARWLRKHASYRPAVRRADVTIPAIRWEADTCVGCGEQVWTPDRTTGAAYCDVCLPHDLGRLVVDAH